MKIVKGDVGRDARTKNIYEAGKFRYELRPDYGTLPEELRFCPYSSGCCDKYDNLFLVTRDPTHPIVMLNAEGDYVKDFGQGLFGELHGVCVSANDTLLCVDAHRHVIRELTKDGKLIRSIGNEDTPSDSGFDPDIWRKMQRQGKMIATDIPFNSAWAFVEGLRTIQRAAPPFNKPTGIAVSPKGEIFVSDGYANASIHKFSADGTLLKTWGGPGSKPGEFVIPHGIWVDRLCRVWVADREGNSVHIFSEEGDLLGYMGEDLYQPSEIWADDEYIYIGERGGGITIIDMNLELVEQIGFYNSSLRTHGLCGTSKSELIILPLHSYEGHYLMRLSRI